MGARGFYPRHPRGWRRRPPCSRCLRRLCFYPRHPRGWRPRSRRSPACCCTVSIHATLAGGDRGRTTTCLLSLQFLSTPPSRVATLVKGGADELVAVSIHATLAGGDWPRRRTMDSDERVSIHATLAGGDTRSGAAWQSKSGFYPRHPRGWRLMTPYEQFEAVYVSIHATLAGGDRSLMAGVSCSPTVSIHATLAGGDARSVCRRP